MPYDFTYMWNPKIPTKQMKKQSKVKLIDAENIVAVARGKGVLEVEKMGGDVQEVPTSSHKINEAWGCNV